MHRYSGPASVIPGSLPQGFFRLYASEGRPAVDENHNVLAVFDYLEHVRTGLRGKPMCPFVEAVHQSNGYRVKFYEIAELWVCGEIALEPVVEELRTEFCRLSPVKTHVGQGLDTTAVIAAFPGGWHWLCYTQTQEELLKQMDKAREEFRQSFLDQGLMLSQMHERHPDPKGTGGYTSRIPLLIVRRMHAPDIVFMKKPEEIAAYRKFFPEA